MRRKTFISKDLFKVARRTLKKLNMKIREELKNAQAGFHEANAAQKRNRKLRSKYYMH